jgi:hypothetical protein
MKNIKNGPSWSIQKSINKLERDDVRHLLVADPGGENVVDTVVLMTSIWSTGEQVVFIRAQGQSKMAAIQILARLCTQQRIF